MSSIFANQAEPNVNGANDQQFPGKVITLVDQSQDFAFGYIEKSVESRVMFLHVFGNPRSTDLELDAVPASR